ncbi:MAG: hypothetical protein LBF82_04015 [Lactobacillales bacterium]|nr:hypothetical protein [Lactobacillales bacterium]
MQTRIAQLPVKKKISLEVIKGGHQRSRKANIEVKYIKGYIPIRGLATKERLQKLIAIKSIIAFKILYLKKVALSNPMETCTIILSNEEVKALYMREHRIVTLPEEPPNIKQAVIWLRKLGGFMNRKSDNLPGTMTLWRSYENLKKSIVMFHIMTSQSCG